MSIRLLALDLDGTLFGDDLVVSPRARQALSAAQERGVVVTIATGRMFRSARQTAADLGIHAPLICYQGALVRHSDTGETLYNKTVPLALARRIIEETTRRGLHLNVYLNEELYVARTTPEAEFYSRINMGLPLREVGDLVPWLDAQGGAEPTKLVIVTDPWRTDALLEEFTAEFGEELQVTKSHARFVEFTNKECSKGRALAVVAGHLGIPREEVMAIGDGHNDLDMIMWAGHGVVMPSSPQALLDVARTVCLPLASGGPADVIEQYVLEAGTGPGRGSPGG